jgi:hypothetical protein
MLGNTIFEFVANLKGRDVAPKITGMLINLKINEIHTYLMSY